MFRYILVVVFMAIVAQSNAQHVSMYWYNLQSVAPLDEVEGKMALTRMKQMTTDSLAYFTNLGDYFQLATKTPIEWESFYAAMNASGYYIADVTQRDTHHEDFVKMGLAYQQAHYLADHPDLCASWSTPVVLLHEEIAALGPDKLSFIHNHPQLFFVKE